MYRGTDLSYIWTRFEALDVIFGIQMGNARLEAVRDCAHFFSPSNLISARFMNAICSVLIVLLLLSRFTTHLVNSVSIWEHLIIFFRNAFFFHFSITSVMDDFLKFNYISFILINLVLLQHCWFCYLMVYFIITLNFVNLKLIFTFVVASDICPTCTILIFLQA